jgi:hypothetical protein
MNRPARMIRTKEAVEKLVKATEAYNSYWGMDENPPKKKH